MKKKVLSVVLAVAMMVSSVLSVIADAIDPLAQQYYDSAVALSAALEGDSVDAVISAMEFFVTISEDENFEMTEKQSEDVITLFGDDYEEAMFDLINDMVIGMLVYEIDRTCDEYNADKNVKSAMEIIEMYESLNDPDEREEMEEMGMGEVYTAVEKFFPNLKDVYDDAVLNGPSKNAADFCKKYTELSEVLDYYYSEDLEATKVDMETALSDLDALTPEELTEVEIILEISKDQIKKDLEDDLAIIKVIAEINSAYEEFLLDYTEESAQVFVDAYESVFGPEGDATIQEYVYGFVFGIDETYEEAKALLEGGGELGEMSTPTDIEEPATPTDITTGNGSANDKKVPIDGVPFPDNGNKKPADKDTAASEEVKSKNEESDHNVGESPKTSDNGGYAFIWLLISSAAIAVLLANKKRIFE